MKLYEVTYVFTVFDSVRSFATSFCDQFQTRKFYGVPTIRKEFGKFCCEALQQTVPSKLLITSVFVLFHLIYTNRLCLFAKVSNRVLLPSTCLVKGEIVNAVLKVCRQINLNQPSSRRTKAFLCRL